MENINRPYVKKYDEDGKLLNPIEGCYLHFNRSRRDRRSELTNKSFTGNQKGLSLIVSGKFKYQRIMQSIVDKLTGETKTVNHYKVV